jgi:hypothetical protein
MQAKVDVHVLGSLQGYSTLRRSSGLSQDVVRELEQVDLSGVGQTDSGPNSMPPTFTQRLSDGRMAVRRVVRGGRDDVGRRTVTVVSLVLSVPDYLGLCQNLGPLIRSPKAWSAALQQVDEASIEIDDPVIDSVETSIDLFQRFAHGASTGVTLLLEKRDLPGFLGLLARLHPDDKLGTRWCIGARTTGWSDVCILDELDAAALKVRRAPVPKLSMSRTGLLAGEFFPRVAEVLRKRRQSDRSSRLALGSIAGRPERASRSRRGLAAILIGAGVLCIGVLLLTFSLLLDVFAGESISNAPRAADLHSSSERNPPPHVGHSSSPTAELSSDESVSIASVGGASDSRKGLAPQLSDGVARAPAEQAPTADVPNSSGSITVPSSEAMQDADADGDPRNDSAEEAETQPVPTSIPTPAPAPTATPAAMPDDPEFLNLVESAELNLQQFEKAVKSWKERDLEPDLVQIARQYAMLSRLMDQGKWNARTPPSFEVTRDRMVDWFPEDSNEGSKPRGSDARDDKAPWQPTEAEVLCIGLLKRLIAEDAEIDVVKTIFLHQKLEDHAQSSFPWLPDVMNELDLADRRLSSKQREKIGRHLKSEDAKDVMQLLSDPKRIRQIWEIRLWADADEVLDELQVLRKIDESLSEPRKDGPRSGAAPFCFMAVLPDEKRKAQLENQDAFLIPDLAQAWCDQLRKFSDVVAEMDAIMTQSAAKGEEIPSAFIRSKISAMSNRGRRSDRDFLSACLDPVRVREEIETSLQLRER